MGPPAAFAAIAHVFPIARPFAPPLEQTTAHYAGAWRMSVLRACDARHGSMLRSPAMNLLIVVNASATWVMVGIIWFVQVVHYPLLATVPAESARKVAVDHQARTSRVVMLPMAAEGITTLWLMFDRPSTVQWWLAWAGGLCVAVALASTVLLSVPRHTRMASEPTDELGRELVKTNWPRTLAWTLHGVVCAAIMARSL